MDTTSSTEKKNRELQAQIDTLQTDLKKSQHVFEQIESFSAQLGLPVELHEIYRNSIQLFKDLLSLDYSSLFLKGPKPETLVIQDTLGFPEALIGNFTIRKGVGLPGLVAFTQRVETIEEVDNEKRIDIPDIVYKENIHSAIAVPMMHGKELFGVIVGHTRKRTLFSEHEQRLAQIFANQSATAIENTTHIQSLNISQKTLKERSSELESIFENSVTGIMLLKEGRILARCNQKLADVMGYESQAEMQGLNMRALHLSEERYQEIGEILYTPMKLGKQAHTEYQLCKKDGTPIWAEISGRALDRNTPPDLAKGVVLIIDDISQRKKMEEEILHNRKLESFAIMTGGLGHDFNNIITAILGNIDLSMTVLNPENQASSFLQSAKEATLRAKDLTHRLQTFSKESKPVLQTTSLPELIQKADSLFSYQEISLASHFTEDLKPVEIDARQIDKAIRSLLKNSAQAMPDGGEIHISCSNFDNEGDITGLRRASYVKTTITDTGQGIPADIINKIFDPYFTTKTRSNKKGSGLGLATVHSIIQRHKGVITAKSNEESSGATFTFYLPASQVTQNGQTDEAHHKDKILSHQQKKVLVMDDDEGIRDIIVQMLTLTGYEVETAVDGETAVALYRAALDTDPFQVIIMDINIPLGMGGVDAVRKIGELDKDAKVIVSSGDAMDPVMLDYKSYGFTAAVSKPFDFSELHKALSKIFTP